MPQIIEVPNYGQVEFPDGMSDADIVSAIKKTSMGYKSANGFGSKLNDAIGQIPRQLGLTARYALEGGIGALGLATDPIARLAGIPTAQEAGSSLATVRALPPCRSARYWQIATDSVMRTSPS